MRRLMHMLRKALKVENHTDRRLIIDDEMDRMADRQQEAARRRAMIEAELRLLQRSDR